MGVCPPYDADAGVVCLGCGGFVEGHHRTSERKREFAPGIINNINESYIANTHY